jgi:hypothetical protein
VVAAADVTAAARQLISIVSAVQEQVL